MLFRNLRAEMAREDILLKDLAEHLNVRCNTISCKTKGTTEWTLSEMLKIKERFFPHLTIDYLFQK